MSSIRYYINAVINDIKKILSNKEFYISIITAFIILGISKVYISETGKEYSTFDGLWEGKEFLESNLAYFNREMIIYNVSSKLWMFAPLVSMFPLINVLVNERQKGAIRFNIFRIGINKYILAKFSVAFITGGSVTLLGYLMYCIMARLCLPSDYETIAELMSYGMELNYGDELLGYFLVGAMSAIVGYAIASFINNLYLILCVPFILNYMSFMFASNYLSYNLEPDSVYYRIIYAFVFSNSLSIRNADDTQKIYMYSSYLLIVILAVSLWNIIFKKKIDCGG